MKTKKLLIALTVTVALALAAVAPLQAAQSAKVDWESVGHGEEARLFADVSDTSEETNTVPVPLYDPNSQCGQGEGCEPAAPSVTVATPPVYDPNAICGQAEGCEPPAPSVKQAVPSL